MRLRDPAIMKDAGLCPFCRAASAGTKKVLTTVCPAACPGHCKHNSKLQKSQFKSKEDATWLPS